MLKLLKQAANLILFSNVFIALCAVAFYLLTFYQLGADPVIDIMAAIVFAATLFVYIFQRLVVLRLHQVVQNHRQVWFHHHLNLMRAVCIICFIFLCISVFFISVDQFIALLGISIISIIYGIPISNRNLRLRDIGIIKIFLISFAWAYISTVLPVVILGERLFSHLPFLIFLERFLFIFAITLPFDIRDRQIDAVYDLKTIPSITGDNAAKWISIVSLILMIIIAFLEFNISPAQPYSLEVLVGLVLSGLITMVVIWIGKSHFSDYYYLGAVDGLILLQLLIVAGLIWLF